MIFSNKLFGNWKHIGHSPGPLFQITMCHSSWQATNIQSKGHGYSKNEVARKENFGGSILMETNDFLNKKFGWTRMRSFLTFML